MRMVCDVLRPSSGEIRFDGRDVRALGDEYRACLGYLPQDFGYHPDFTALDFMCYLAALKGLDRRAARRRSLELLETVGLADVARQKATSWVCSSACTHSCWPCAYPWPHEPSGDIRWCSEVV